MKGLAAFMENELALLQEMQTHPEFEDDAIAAASLGGVEHMVGRGATVESRVERSVLGRVQGKDNELTNEIARLERRLVKVRYTIGRIEAMLSALTQRELLVVQKFYIEGYPWSDVVALYKKEMPSPREADALKATRNAAMTKMNQIYNRCKQMA